MRRALLLLLLAASAGFAEEPGASSPDLRSRLRALADRRDDAALLAAAEEALAADPASAAAWEYRAFALHRLGRQNEARDAYIELLRHAPSNAWAWSQLGSLEADLGRMAEARTALEKAVALAPASQDGWAKLVRLARAEGRYHEALAVLRRAEAAKIAPAWCAAEAAGVAWAAGDVSVAGTETERAARLGAEPAVVANLRRLVSFEALLTDADRRARTGAPWTARVGPFAVETRVAPEVPPRVRAVLRAASERYAEFLGVTTEHDATLQVVLSRTFEEHERRRRAFFPGGPRGSAFTSRSIVNGRWELTVYVAWESDGLERSLAHEASHALLGGRCPGAPSWLDEGLATYLEGWALDEQCGAVREDLVAVLRAGREARKWMPWNEMIHSPVPVFHGPDARLRYAQAWLVVHALLHRKGSAGRTSLLTVLDAYRLGAVDAYQTLCTEMGGDAGRVVDAYWESLVRK